MNLGEHVQAEIRRLDDGDVLLYVILGRGTYPHADEIDRVLGPVDEHGGTTAIFPNLNADDDHVELVTGPASTRIGLRSRCSCWAPGLDTAALEVYQTLRADGLDPAEAHDLAHLVGTGR